MGAKTRGNYPVLGWCKYLSTCENQQFCDKCYKYSHYTKAAKKGKRDGKVE